MSESALGSATRAQKRLGVGMTANQIIHADCVAMLPTFRGESIDFVLTDPPYLANYSDRDGRTVANDDDASWLDPAFAESTVSSRMTASV
jgi:DNA modification methylase